MTYALLRAATRRMLAAALVTLAPALVSAQALPPAAELLAAYTRAVGGEAAFSKFDGMHATGSFAIASMGISATFEMYQARPDRMLMISSLPGVGEIRQGFDGTTAWAIDPMQGARILDGPELKAMIDQAQFDNSLRLMKNFTSAETVEKTTLNGQECYKVKLVWKSGRETFDCYAVADGLLVASISNQETNMGTVEATSLLSDYRDFGGIRMPGKTVVQAMGMEQVMAIESLEWVAPDSTRFALPPEIQALIKK